MYFITMMTVSDHGCAILSVLLLKITMMIDGCSLPSELAGDGNELPTQGIYICNC